MTEVIKWLESPEGEEWSREKHGYGGYNYFLIMIKDDVLSNQKDYMPEVIWVR